MRGFEHFDEDQQYEVEGKLRDGAQIRVRIYTGLAPCKKCKNNFSPSGNALRLAQHHDGQQLRL